jgi:hypothetical protein
MEKNEQKRDANKISAKREMFDEGETKQRIGPKLKKSQFLDSLEEVEDFFITSSMERGYDNAYDVVASENPCFKTLSYTEWGGNFMVMPLNNDLKRDMILDSLISNVGDVFRWDEYYREVVANKAANKYSNRNTTNKVARKSLIVPVGTNKFIDVLDIDKIADICKRESTYVKPHPITTHEYIGLLMDRCGEGSILKRDDDLYAMMINSSKIYTTHYSESMLYAAMLNKDIDVVDRLGRHFQAGFWHFNSFILRTPKEARIPQLNKILSSHHSGVFNPRIEKDWKNKMTMFLDYMDERRRHFEGVFITN